MPDPLQPLPAPRPLRWPEFVFTLQAALAEAAADVYLVGGVVRDAFWGLPSHDIDLAVARDAFPVARRIANHFGGAFYKLDPARETGRAIVEVGGERLIVDVATFRGGDLLADLRGRDFTLNAVAAPLSGDLTTVIDPLGGLHDAQQHILRRCGPASIADDPVRALRAVRQSVRFGLRIDPTTLADIRRDGPRLLSTSPERVRDEFMIMLGGARPAAALRTLDALGLLELIVPEVVAMRGVPQSAPHHQDVWAHTLLTVERLADVIATIGPQRTPDSAAAAGPGMIVYYLDRFRAPLQAHLRQRWPNERTHIALLVLAALLHDSGKPATRQDEGERIRYLGHEQIGAELAEARGTALVLSRDEVTWLAAVVRQHMRPLLLDREARLTRRAIYRFWRDCGAAGLDVCLLALADTLASAGPHLDPAAWSHFLQTTGALLDGYFGVENPKVVDLPPLVSGGELMAALGLEPGPQIGALLEAIREAQATGLIHSPAEALALARKQLPAD
ncbi:MAG: CCA tRNA nucleotidyltransferase [Anaerolineae bacterium]|nr:CCA tRNA nucleotidyltransferase [Anaerolineae bacterium]